MPPPKRHHTHGRSRRRRSHHALQPAQFSACVHCGAAVRPHQVCRECGYYGKAQVVDVLARAEKKAKKRRDRTAPSAQAGREEQRGESLEDLAKKT